MTPEARREPLRWKSTAHHAALMRALAALGLAFALVYVAGLTYLAARGGARALTFTAYASPPTGVPGEGAVRALVGGLFGALLGWAAAALAAYVAGRRRFVHGALVAAGALAGTLALGDHVPRFLISMPSETQPGGGVGPEIFNTLYLAVLTTVLTTPLGVGAAVYLARFAASRALQSSARVALDTLASLPSIVYGLFGFLVFVAFAGAGYSLLAGACVLSLLNLPLVVAVAEEAIRSVPRELEDASLALGATPVQTVFRVTLPYAWPGILSAIVLAIGRVFAESAPLIMTAGTTVARNSAYSLDPLRGGETLAVHLWYVNSSGLAPDRAQVSAGTAAVLVALVIATNVVAARLARFGGAEGTRARRAAR